MKVLGTSIANGYVVQASLAEFNAGLVSWNISYTEEIANVTLYYTGPLKNDLHSNGKGHYFTYSEASPLARRSPPSSWQVPSSAPVAPKNQFITSDVTDVFINHKNLLKLLAHQTPCILQGCVICQIPSRLLILVSYPQPWNIQRTKSSVQVHFYALWIDLYPKFILRDKRKLSVSSVNGPADIMNWTAKAQVSLLDINVIAPTSNNWQKRSPWSETV